ncbi:Sugar lactone lactonase YvrE [Palleronia marisminoris]|uniref:L-arabinolactonase n=1 Tax=Palleronia marisminoris TaxID=315423 RepID=A0A1Y5RIG4_9RHOB|nr:SMP-30/gluconolactonase/LRE family protein [Palleronia marisminoris]SFG22593.1 Sugar lactone lactonase YvrE [Palleronia marisminoris]SLN18042.1 L-arabinolactonase [Palleronia marisminoris]
MTEVHDHTRCLLGEGPLWHPERQQFYWCDILSRRVLTVQDGCTRGYEFDRFVSCLAWVDERRLLVGTRTDLTLLDLDTGAQEHVVPLEAENAATRSNDGRVDPWGGFWVSTMATGKGEGAGSIYRYREGQLTKLIGGLTIPNAICFSPDRQWAYFADTPTGIINRWRLGEDGTPQGDPEPFIDESDNGHSPDGAVTDADGRLCVAHWGSSRVAIYDADGAYESEVRLPARQITCPSFGGPDLTSLYVTSAMVGLPEEAVSAEPGHGKTFRSPDAGRGRPEPRVIL